MADERDRTRPHAEIQEPPQGLPGTPTRVDHQHVAPVEPATGGARGKLRRRLRKLRAVRARQWAELGALVVDARRRSNGSRPEVLERRAAEAAEVDRQVRRIADEIDTLPDTRVLMTGIGGTCRGCGDLLSTEDSFCPACGTPTSPRRRRPVHPASEAEEPGAPAPAPAAPSMPPPPSDLQDAAAPPPPPAGAPLAHADPAAIPPPPPPR